MVYFIREDDLSSEATRELIKHHQSNMLAISPPGTSYALNLSGLSAPHVTVWSVRDGEDVASIGALAEIGETQGEIKSMRTHPDHLGQGLGATLLEHIIHVARARGYGRLSLETGTSPDFAAATNLYLRRGFRPGETFGSYLPGPHNQCFHLDL